MTVSNIIINIRNSKERFFNLTERLCRFENLNLDKDLLKYNLKIRCYVLHNNFNLEKRDVKTLNHHWKVNRYFYTQYLLR